MQDALQLCTFEALHLIFPPCRPSGSKTNTSPSVPTYPYLTHLTAIRPLEWDRLRGGLTRLDLHMLAFVADSLAFIGFWLADRSYLGGKLTHFLFITTAYDDVRRIGAGHLQSRRDLLVDFVGKSDAQAQDIALNRAGFELLDYYVVHSENPISVHIANLNALTDDAILVLAVKGSATGKTWHRPSKIRTSESATFCRDCSEALGWILATSMTDAEISEWWREQLGKRTSD